MAKVNSEEYNKALEEYLQEGIGWDAGMFDINAKNNHGDYEQFAADSFHAGWQAANESEGKCNICSVSQQRELLLAFAKHIEKAGYDGSCLTYEQELDEFLKANNCG